MGTATILEHGTARDHRTPVVPGHSPSVSFSGTSRVGAPFTGVTSGSAIAAALCAELSLGLRASYRHLATLHLAAGSPARAAAMLRAAETLG